MAKKYIDADLLRKEIERRIKRNKEEYAPDGLFEVQDNFAKLLAFLDTLPEQPASEGLEEEIETEADKTFFANGWYEGDHHQPRLDISLEEFRDIARHFAEWQKAKMLEGAVEGEIMTNGLYPYEPRVVAPFPNCPYSFGDKVKIIIVKEDEK